MIVTIDGPAGSGKSTVARQLAQRLGYEFLDTGAMYRVVTLVCLRDGLDLADETRVADRAGQIRLHMEGTRISVDDEDVSQAIRSNDVSHNTRLVAPHPRVRDLLTRWQRELAVGRNLVTEGRDQGTVVFPQAECKFFLTASPEERAQRRHRDLAQRGEDIPMNVILDQQQERDRQDAERKVAPLKPAADARLIDTTGRRIADVVNELETIVRSTGCR